MILDLRWSREKHDGVLPGRDNWLLRNFNNDYGYGYEARFVCRLRLRAPGGVAVTVTFTETGIVTLAVTKLRRRR
ncbi:MAG: hypothetical protein V1789_06915 [PVC group bacterium]